MATTETGTGATRAPPATRQRRTIRADDATRIVQLGAAVLLGGGFYYGYTTQQRAAAKEMKLKGSAAKTPVQQPVVPVRPVTLFERKLGLHRPQSSGSAAFRALVGGTIMAGTGAAVILLGVGGMLGATNPTEFRERMEDLTQSMGIEPVVSDFGSEEAELDHLAKIFEDGMREDIEAQGGHVQSETESSASNSRV